MSEYPCILSKNLLNGASVSGAGFDEHPIYKIEYMADLSRMSKWQGGSGSTQRVVWSLAGGEAQADTFILDRNSDITGGSPRLTLQHGGGPSGPWTDCQLASGGPARIDSPGTDTIHWLNLQPRTGRYWSVLLEDLGGMQRPPSIFNLWLGERLQLDFGPAGDFDPYEEELTGEPVQGASGGFLWNQRFRRRVLRASFENLTGSRYALLRKWWSEAGRDGRNWWWLSFPQSEPEDALYLNCEGASARFAINSTVRSGEIEAREVI